MNDLIEQLEKAVGVSRSLEQAIFRACPDLINEKHCAEWCRMDGRTDLTRDRYLDAWAPDFTRSIDAAMTLVPQGLTYTIMNYQRPPEVLALLYRKHEDVAETEQFSGKSRRAPIALCIAALKARVPLSPAQGKGE